MSKSIKMLSTIDRLSAAYTALNGKDGAKIEIEAKYRSFLSDTDGRIKQHNYVSRETYYRVINYYLQRNNRIVEQKTYEKINEKGEKRQSLVAAVNVIASTAASAATGFSLQESKVTYMIKRIPQGFTLGETEYDQYGIKLSFQEEREIKMTDTQFGASKIERLKERKSFVNIEDVAQVDATIVSSTKDGVMNQHYEVEVEFTPNPNYNVSTSLHKFNQIVWLVKRIVDDTPAPIPTSLKVPQSEIESFFRGVNQILTGKSDFKTITGLANVETLTFKNLENGYLVGNRRVDPDTGLTLGTRYSATWKVDGVRTLLIFLNNRIWLIQQNSANTIPIFEYGSKIQGQDILNGTIIDGELVPMDSRRNFGKSKPELWFIPFDIVAKQGSLNVQSHSFFDRLNYIRQISKIITIPYLEITIKQFVEILNVHDFYFQMQSMFVQHSELNYNTDGIIFTPVDAGYNPELVDLKTWNYDPRRILTKEERKLLYTNDKRPMILKWKDVITIDFKPFVRQDGTTILQYSEGSTLTQFTGDTKNSFNNEIDLDNKIHRQAILNGYIAEYEWVSPGSQKFVEAKYDDSKYPNGIFVAIRLRPDKVYPNGKKAVFSNWKAIHDYVSQDILTGHHNFKLLFKYHNRIKRQLFDSVNGTLLDIGSGIGGDISKWKNFSKVVAVEPDAEKIPELKRRISLLPPDKQRNILVVQIGGEDHETITRSVLNFITNKVDVVSMMLSMSFFWGNRQMLLNLITTITNNLKPDGRFIYLTIDGSGVKKVYQQCASVGTATKPDLMIGPGTLQLNAPSNELKINIQGSKTVKDQVEYLVDLQDFYSLLNAKQQLPSVHPAIDEKFLSANEKLFTQMYSYGIIDFDRNRQSTVLTPEIKELKVVRYGIPIAIEFSIASESLPLLEAILTAGSKRYRSLTRQDQIKDIQKLRSEISSLVVSTNKNGVNYWEMYGDNLYHRFIDSLIAQKRDDALKYSSVGIARWLTSRVESENKKTEQLVDLDSSFVGILGATLGVDIIVLSPKGVVVNSSHNSGKNIIVLLMTDNRYQVLGLKDSYNNMMTIISPSSAEGMKLINGLRSVISPDYDKTFIDIAVNKFKTSEGSRIPTDEDFIKVKLLIRTNNGSIVAVDNYYRKRLNYLTNRIQSDPRYLNIAKISSKKTLVF